MLVGLLKRFKGYVEFYAEGGFAERFINLCATDGIVLSDVKNDGVKVYACTDFDGYKRIKRCARGSGMRVKIIKKHGISVVFKKKKARIGALFGIAAAAVLVLLATGSVWSVNVEGASSVKVESLTEALADLGVFVGARKSKIDTEGVAKALLYKNPELSWASLNMYGTRVVLEVREVTASPETEDLNVPINIVASKRGRVILINGYRGTNRVKAGDYVEKGDILISGVTENRDLSENIVRASGSVICETQNSFEAFSPYENSFSVCENTRSLYKLYFFGLEIPLYFKKGEKAAIGFGKSSLKGGSENLPVAVLWETGADFENTSTQLGEEECFLKALLLCVEEKRKILLNCEVSSFEMSENVSELGVTVSFNSECTEDVAKECEFYWEASINE